MSRPAWEQLRTLAGTAVGVPEALTDLAGAKDEAAAGRAYWQLDNRLVVQGQLFPAAIAATPVLLAMLVGPLHHWARIRIADLLLQIGAGSTDATEVPYGRDLGVEARTLLRDACWTLYGMALDDDQRLAEAALELAASVDTDRDRRDSVLVGLVRAGGPLAQFANELILETGNK